jgi:nucleoside-diphosphate-sugar epimerase
MTRSASKRTVLEQLGAVPVVADALDAAAVADAVARARPDVIVHELTAIPEALDTRHPDRAFELTNRLRTEGTDHLLSAGRAVGVGRFVAQSNIGAYGFTGAPVKTEEDAIDLPSTGGMRANVEAIRHLEEAVLGATWTEGVVLRYGWFYGPGTSMAPGQESYELIRRRRFPVVGDGGGVWSFIHVADAAEATVAAVEHGTRGIYNVVDDEPAAVAELAVVGAENVGDRVVGDGEHDDLALQLIADGPGAHLAGELVGELAGAVGARSEQHHPMAAGEQSGRDATRHVAGADDRDLHAAALGRSTACSCCSCGLPGRTSDGFLDTGGCSSRCSA